MKIKMNIPSRTETTKGKGKQRRESRQTEAVEVIELEIPDNLIRKTVAVIDELLQRTWDDLENVSWDEAHFPPIAYPFPPEPFEPENQERESRWMRYWMTETLENNLLQRNQILDIIAKSRAVDVIDAPVINELGYSRDGEPFKLNVNRDVLTSLRRRIVLESKTFTLTYNRSREIWVDDQFQLSGRLEFEGKPDRFMGYMLQHQNAKVPKAKIVEAIEEPIDRLTKFVGYFGFKGEIKKAFFPGLSDKRSVRFRPLVTMEDRQHEGIDTEQLMRELQIAHASKAISTNSKLKAIKT